MCNLRRPGVIHICKSPLRCIKAGALTLSPNPAPALLFLLLASVCALAEPIRLHPLNPHYFLWRGRPTVLVTSGEHYGAVLNLDFDYRRYLSTLHREGMNLTRLFTGTYAEVPGSFGIRRNTLAPARRLAPWPRRDRRYDLDSFDPPYFDRLKDFFAEAASRGIVVELTLFSSHYTAENWAISPFYTPALDRRLLHTLDNGPILAHQERLVRKLVRELNPFDNLIYEIQNEPWSDRTVTVDAINPYLPEPALSTFPNAVDLADDASLAWQARVASWIAQEESSLPNRHLIAQNYANFRYPVHHLVPGVSIVNFHYAWPEAAALNYGLGKPIAYDETGFLGAADFTYRRQAWEFLLAGGASFDALDYSFTLGHEDGTDTAPNGPGGGSPALRRQLKVLSDFVNSLDLANARPDPAVVVHAYGAHTQCLSASGRYAVYVRGVSPARLELLLPPGDYTAEWIDTQTGALLRRDALAGVAGPFGLTSPPFQDDIALRLTYTGAPSTID